MQAVYERFQPPERVLLGPGPSPVDDRVLRAIAAPVLGHLDPLFLSCMDDVQSLLRYVFETENRVTIPISATRSAGMEAALVNVMNPLNRAELVSGRIVSILSFLGAHQAL